MKSVYFWKPFDFSIENSLHIISFDFHSHRLVLSLPDTGCLVSFPQCNRTSKLFRKAELSRKLKGDHAFILDCYQKFEHFCKIIFLSLSVLGEKDFGSSSNIEIGVLGEMNGEKSCQSEEGN